MFICIPILFGCQTRVKHEGDPLPRLCPRCNNASVFSAKSTTWFDLFFIPIVPLSKKHIWLCGICQWSAPIGPGMWEPAQANHGYPMGDMGWQQPPPLAVYQPSSGGPPK